ncbi:hypothetical protein FN846DRAFT_945813 [Sphaerosporella brunnea]|uniref:Nephrocystin 3-like N-terminal domain-containing protein n=1 Tax=Sphaerosporella brunnea TaxID=1250544 RepID=A0A5J5F087_9PEZI|nr:hypothetical protein FN846DRAFT_945813 [Sphaerosporella brunnea]
MLTLFYGKLRTPQMDADGTFTWFLKAQAFRFWATMKKPASLLIIGALGEGKTVLSKFVLKNLNKEKQKNLMIIYFFLFRSGR